MAVVRAPSVRPPLLPFEVELEIEGYALVNYPVPAERLEPHLAPGLTLATTILDHRPTAWLSVFLGRNVVRRIAGMPALPISFNLVNYCTYVQGPEGRRQFILRSLMGPELLARGVRLLPQLPAEPCPFYFAPAIVDGRLIALEAEVGEQAAELRLVLETMHDAPWTPGFAKPGVAVEFLGNVPEALYPLSDGRCGQMFAHHPPLVPDAGRVVEARYAWLEETGMLTAAEARSPASVFLQACVDFPTRL